MLYHGVTLGGQVLTQTKRHPTLEDNVTIGAGAKVLGPITVGKGSAVGANAVVTKDVPECHIATGIPATNRPRKPEEKIKLVDPDYYI
jgi:serine O-acetyltransferase